MKILIEYFEKNQIAWDSQMINKLDAYMNGILQWNEHINLTAIREPEDFIRKHYLDSLSCILLPEYQEAGMIADMGTGAGFPGIPLSIFSPEKKFVLMDSLQKRLNVIEQLCADIGIDNVITVHGRAEDLGRQPAHREKYDLCLSRAVANLSVLCEYCLPIVKQGGYMMAYKGRDAENELTAAEGAIRKLGGSFENMIPTPLDREGDEHKLLLIKKTGPTGSKYPRKAGTPAKEPLK